jgi:hypothetical protein
MSPKKMVSYERECWEVAFPNDPDGEDTRGITEAQAKHMLKLGWIEVQYEGIVKNSYDEAVYSHTYRPTADHDANVWDAYSNEMFVD